VNATARTAGAVPARTKLIGLVLGVVAFLVVLAAPAFTPEPAAQRVAAVTLLMAIWWITEAAPLSVTALLPLVLFPVLGVSGVAAAAAPYADQVIFLLLGGFVLAAAMERCGLHRRAGLACVAAIGTTPRRLLAGVMIATAAISMWVSNTATTALMLPVAMSVLLFCENHCEAMDERSSHNLGAGLLLGVAYAAAIGGLGTLIGTPGGALMAGYVMREHGIEVGFAQYMMIGIPFMAVMLPLTWGLLCWRHPVTMTVPGAAEMLKRERDRFGPMSKAEWRVALVFLAAAIGWVFRPLLEPLIPGLSDAGVAITAALALFLLPSGSGGRLAEAEDLRSKVPWDVLLLFGGGLSMAAAVSSSGLAAYLGDQLTGLRALPMLAILVLTASVPLLATQLTSNTATTATFLPVGGAVAVALGADPLIFCLAVTLAANCAFALPVGTPPNAMVYGTGRMTQQDMFRGGLLLLVVATAAITLATMVVAPLVFG
jgi:sodium-dependent dicarboxylate transporter 2/3/5